MLAIESTRPKPSQDQEADNHGASIIAPMMASVDEWTRAEAITDTADELFGQKLPVITSRYLDTQGRITAELESIAFEEFRNNLGFRGVLELPATLAQARAWLE